MVRLLQITDETRSEVEKVKAYALEHPFDKEWAEAVIASTRETVGDDPNYLVHIHQGFRVVYSVDVHDGTKHHHLSISHENGYPGIPEAELILELFGIGKSVHDLDNVWIENEMKAINFLKEFQ